MFDTCICADHDGGPDPYTETMPVARKAHRCCECGAVIAPGEQYERIEGRWEGRWETCKTCIVCARIRQSLFSCWIYGQMWSDIHDHHCGWEDGEFLCLCPQPEATP